MDPEELKRRFTAHPPKGDQAVRYELVRAHGRAFAEVLDGYCPDSAELSRAITYIESAIFWANAAIARNE